MFYLIETKNQFQQLKEIVENNSYCWLDYIQGNDNTHPALAEIIAVYIKPKNDKGYIIPINHPECINWDKNVVFNFLSGHNFYVKDKKAALHINPMPLYTDIQHIHYLEKNELFPDEFDTQAHTHYYRKFPQIKVNKIIPIGKHLESCEQRQCALSHVFSTNTLNVSGLYNAKILPNLYEIEKNGLKINDEFKNYFTTKNNKHSIKNNNIYGWYNPYTTTGRPVNNFNGINFVGLKHDNGERNCFEPINDFFVEMDYDGYHPRLIGDMVGYKFEDNVHNTLAKIYFKTDKITPEEYKLSKEITFKQIYGGIRKENLHHPFFYKTQKYIDKNWDKFEKEGFVETPQGKKILKHNHKNITKQKLFNYLIQSLETETNIEKIGIINKYLKNKKTKLVLYVYDAFIFDFSKKDGKSTLVDLQEILSNKFPTKIKIGEHYGALR